MKSTVRALSGPLSVLALSVLALTACGQSGSGFVILDEPAAAGDALPPGAVDADVLRDGSSRFLAEVPTHRGTRAFYLARRAGQSPADAAPVCLAEANSGVVSCGTGGITAGFLPGEAQAVPDGEDVSGLLADGWVAVHENLLVRGFTATP